MNMKIALIFVMVISTINTHSEVGKTHFIVGNPRKAVFPTHQLSRSITPPFTQKVLSDAAAYFSCDDNIQHHLITLIDQEKEAIFLAVYMFTDEKVAQALCNARRRGVNIELITDISCLKDRASKIDILSANGCIIYIYNPTITSRGTSLMHHKFALFRNCKNKPRIWTGSYNFTKAAHSINQEHVIIFSDQLLFHKFIEQFEKLKVKTYKYTKGIIRSK